MAQTILSAVTAKDMKLAYDYFDAFTFDPSGLPVACTYRNEAYKGMPGNSTVSKEFIDANMVRTVFLGNIGQKQELQIRAECIQYRDYPVVEWTVYFTNTGHEDSEILSDVLAINTKIKGKNAVLVHNNGDFNSADGYAVTYLSLCDGDEFAQSPEGGRPSDRAFPYQRILFDGFGFNLSIGWPGQWSCGYKGQKDGVFVKAGQETVHTYLKSGETFRTPRITLMVFDGNEIRGINIWRRWFNAHVTPRSRGGIVEPRIVMCETGGGIEFTKATEKNQLEGIAFVKENNIDVNMWWIDAGWYPCKNKDGEPIWYDTGSWCPDPERFPNGLAPVGKACKEAGMDFLVWFEPERVRSNENTQIEREHPEWLLSCKEDTSNYLLDITNPDCFKWLCETISSLLIESGINCYRQDFNFPPLTFWRSGETPGRRGMAENQYIQAYLAYWDYLLLNVPGLWIDSCSSGGRRNDMETLRRSVALHPTDYGYGYHHVNQAFRHTIHSWFPYARGWTDSWDKNNEYYPHEDYYDPVNTMYDNYRLINGFGSLTMMGLPAYMKYLNGDFTYIDKICRAWKRFSQIQLNGDFYALTENHRDFTKWTVFQFDRPEAKEGVFQVLRNNQAKDESLRVKPFAFDAGAEYIFENGETGETYTQKGSDITKKGIVFTQPVRSGSVWFYRVKL